MTKKSKSTSNRKRPYIVFGISSRALFNLEHEHSIFEKQGLEEYKRYQIKNEHSILEPGCGFPLVRSILDLNKYANGGRTSEVVIMSRNNPQTCLRILKSIEHHKLDISRAIFTSGTDLSDYLAAFDVDLYLSHDKSSVQAAANAGLASAMVYPPPSDLSQPVDQIRIAFDGDAVLFSDESERIYQEEGLEAFLKHERINATRPLPEGPFAKLLKTLAYIQSELTKAPISIKLSLVTARSNPAVERVILTLREWKVNIDEAFFLGGKEKERILKAIQPHIFFDDRPRYTEPAAKVVPTGLVPQQQ